MSAPDGTSGGGATTVIDGGARYRMHPSWRDFGGQLNYFAFEPDEAEARRLLARRQPPGFEIVGCALARTTGQRDLYLTKHRGYSSFLEVDPESEWFKRYRPGEGELEAVIRVNTCSVDEFAAAARNVQHDLRAGARTWR